MSLPTAADQYRPGPTSENATHVSYFDGAQWDWRVIASSPLTLSPGSTSATDLARIAALETTTSQIIIDASDQSQQIIADIEQQLAWGVAGAQNKSERVIELYVPPTMPVSAPAGTTIRPRQRIHGMFPSSATDAEKSVLPTDPACIAEIYFELEITVEDVLYKLYPKNGAIDFSVHPMDQINGAANWLLPLPFIDVHHPAMAHLYPEGVAVRRANEKTFYILQAGATLAERQQDPQTSAGYS